MIFRRGQQEVHGTLLSTLHLHFSFECTIILSRKSCCHTLAGIWDATQQNTTNRPFFWFNEEKTQLSVLIKYLHYFSLSLWASYPPHWILLPTSIVWSCDKHTMITTLAHATYVLTVGHSLSWINTVKHDWNTNYTHTLFLFVFGSHELGHQKRIHGTFQHINHTLFHW